jgi:hypothetical protein
VTAGVAWTSGTYSDTNDSASGSTYDESGQTPTETNYGVVNYGGVWYAVPFPYAPVPNGSTPSYSANSAGHSYSIHQTQSTSSDVSDSGSAQVSGGVTTSASGTYSETDVSNSTNKQTDNGSGTYAYTYGSASNNGSLSTSLVYNSTAGGRNGTEAERGRHSDVPFRYPCHFEWTYGG